MGAHMVPFGGWDMPLEYTGIVAEHMAVRTRAGLFDVSHMGEIEIAGKQALALLQKVTCNDVSRLQVNQAQYSGLMNDRGSFVDDLLVHKFSDEHYFLCVNAARREADFDWITQQNDPGATVRNTSDDYTQLALQGPKAKTILQRLTSVDLSGVRYYWFARGKVSGAESIIAHTGYTGEDGFEIYVPVADSERIWNEVLEAGKDDGLIPCGLGARNTLRLEAGMMLYGHDINAETTPLEANLQWICKLDKGPFLGRDVLLRQAQEGISKKLVGFQMTDRAIARDDAPVWSNDRQVGKVTSGSYVPYLKRAIGLAYVPTELAKSGERVQIEIRGNKAAAEIVPTPFYRRPKS
ncbi:MAG: glycine cleavage system aminomethyltransferase GcvT [Acidobacteria bacterium]|nr:glycine cleavage system aminomethyltransferase GcvT [Acidobacteriota bacterium]